MKCNQCLFSDTRTEILLTRLIENLKVLDFSLQYLSRSPVKVNRLSHGILIIPRLTQQLLQISKDQQKNFCLLREDNVLILYFRHTVCNASSERPILEQLLGESSSIFPCSDRPWKLRHFFKWWRTFKQNYT